MPGYHQPIQPTNTNLITDIYREYLKSQTQLSPLHPPVPSPKPCLPQLNNYGYYFALIVFFAVFPTVMMLSASEVELHSLREVLCSPVVV